MKHRACKSCKFVLARVNGSLMCVKTSCKQYGKVVKLMTCPKCKGTGKIKQTPGGGFALNPGNRMHTVTCGRCGGTGRVRETWPPNQSVDDRPIR